MKRYGAEGTRLRVCPRWHLERGEGVRSWGLRPSSSPPQWRLCSWGRGGSLSPGEGDPWAPAKAPRGLWRQQDRPCLVGDVAFPSLVCARRSRACHLSLWGSATPGPAPSSVPQGPGPPVWSGLVPLLLPLMPAPSSLRGGPLPREAAIPSLPCHAQITSVLWEQGRAPGSWSTVASPTPRHLDVWDWALGEPGAE